MKQIDSNKSLNEKILKGVNVLADAVSATLGPRGRNVIIKGKNLKPMITKDGVTVSKFIDLEDPFENLGAQIVKQAAEATVASCGDGTTTSTVIARAILTKAQSYIAAGDSPIELKRGIDKAVARVIEEIKPFVKEVDALEQVEQIATISANGDKSIGKLISVAVDKIGKDGAITIQESRSSETVLDVSEGFTFDSGLLAGAFVTDERRGCMRYEDCLVLVTDRNISTIDEILPVLEIAGRDGRPLIIIAENVEGQALAAIIMNAMKGTLKAACIKAPRYGEERRQILEDIAVVTKSAFITRSAGINLKQVQLGMLGTAKIIESNKVATTIVSNADIDKVNKRIEGLKQQIQATSDMRVAEKIQERITRLSSGIAIVKVGGSTEVEMIEKKHRIEDALEAVAAAQKEGIVPGGGTVLVRAAQCLGSVEVDNEEQRHGVDIIRTAIKAPFRQIAENAGLSADVLEKDVVNSDWVYGYDISTGKDCNLIEQGIIDPFKVVRSALQNAASAAGTLLTTSVAVVEL